jgi:hypothetical protein
MLAEFEPPGECKARRAFDLLNDFSCISFSCAKGIDIDGLDIPFTSLLKLSIEV